MKVEQWEGRGHRRPRVVQPFEAWAHASLHRDETLDAEAVVTGCSVKLSLVRLTPRIRKLTLTSHVTFSVGWLGAVLAYLVVAIVGLTSTEVREVSSTYQVMQIMITLVIIPCAIAAFASGLVQSLATEWGLFRHRWIVAKLAITFIGTIVLLLHAPRVADMARKAAESAFASGDDRAQRLALVVHAAGGLGLLVAATALSVFKPWGKTAHGRGDVGARKRYVLVGLGVVLVLFIVLHLGGGAPRH